MKNTKKHDNNNKKAKFKPGSKKKQNKCIVTFDDKQRQDYLTGFHKRKVERRKAAVAEIKKKIKDEQIRVREERHKEYMKMLKERTEALEEAEDMITTSTSESVQYDHPNHIVTVTTISDLDLTGAHLLGPAANQVNGEDEGEDKGDEEVEKTGAMPRKAGNPILNKKIRSLTSSLNAYTTKRKGKGKQEGQRGRGHQKGKRPAAQENKKRSGRTSKWQRRRQAGKKQRHQDDR